jgi:hypothetical protein
MSLLRCSQCHQKVWNRHASLTTFFPNNVLSSGCIVFVPLCFSISVDGPNITRRRDKKVNVWEENVLFVVIIHVPVVFCLWNSVSSTNRILIDETKDEWIFQRNDSVFLGYQNGRANKFSQPSTNMVWAHPCARPLHSEKVGPWILYIAVSVQFWTFLTEKCP